MFLMSTTMQPSPSPYHADQIMRFGNSERLPYRRPVESRFRNALKSVIGNAIAQLGAAIRLLYWMVQATAVYMVLTVTGLRRPGRGDTARAPAVDPVRAGDGPAASGSGPVPTG